MDANSKEQQKKGAKDQKIIGEGVKFEHYQRACCRVVGDPVTFPTHLKQEVLDRVKHT